MLTCFNQVELKAGNISTEFQGASYQGFTVSGLVTATDDLPLPGVNVIELGSNRGTITDADGRYTLEVAGPDAEIEFRFIGYLDQTIKLNGQTRIDIILQEKVEELDEVVVIGYGLQKKSDLTGAVESVKVEEMQKLSVPSIAEALQGRAAGVYVTKNSGQPGEDATIYIRGPGSVNNSSPLWIIDGIPSSAGNHLDMSDIESIEILKDASAAAIYGAKAANGVILVSTKRGKTGKPRINFKATYGITQAMGLPDLVNSRDYATLRHESYLNGNFLAGLDQVYTGIVNNPDSILPINTDWMDVLYDNGVTQNYILDFSGGNENSNFYTSVGYYGEEGTYLKTSFNRITATLNSDHKIAKWFTIGQSLTLSQTKRDGKNSDNAGALRVSPYMEVFMDPEELGHPYTPYGVLGTEYGFVGPNMYGVEDIHDQEERWYRLLGNLYMNINPVKGLNWRTTLGGNLEIMDNEDYTVPYDLGHTIYRDVDRLEQSHLNLYGLTMNSVLNYTFSVKNHEFEIMAGMEIQDNWGDGYSMSAEDFRDGLIIYNQSDPESRTLNGEDVLPTRWSSQFARINYNYAGKYLLTANIRRDGSSIFPTGNRIGYFPSFSAGWWITKEDFMSGMASVMAAKIRIGYGSVGNASAAPFSYYSQYFGNKVYYVFGNNLLTGVLPSVFGVGDIQWEQINTTNFGLEFYLFDYKLSITNDFYIRDTRDMLIPIDLPPGAGLGLDARTTVNAGNIRNIGNDLTIQYRNQINDFQYSVGASLGWNKHEVLDLIDQEINKGNLSQFKTEVGKPMSYYIGYDVERIWQEEDIDDIISFLVETGQLTNAEDYDRAKYTAPGDFKYVDQNGDGFINDEDRVLIGSPWPKLSYGFNLDAQYKGFDLTAFFQGVYGNDIYHLNKRVTDNLTGDYSFTNRAFGRWTPENPTDQPRIVYADPNANLTQSSSYFVEKGSYLRLKNLQIGYSIPMSLSTRIKIEKLRIYANAQNLLTFTKYTGIDPEISTGGNTDRNNDEGMYPQSRVYQLGIQLSF
ncbi:MAG: TonB-dependent receptor [Bacteroidota bacterium]